MIKEEKVKRIRQYFNEILPSADCELNYSAEYELLIAVVLSAQTTDKKVNEVTKTLFKKYPTIDDYNKASVSEIENDIKVIGLYKAKALAIKDIASKLKNNFNYKVPDNKKDLMTMRGVGNKVANVVLVEIFNKEEFPVDTHVFRVAKRLGLANKNDSILEVEKKLRKVFKKEEYKLLHHQFIHFGRYYCKAINPSCENCKMKDFCLDVHLKASSTKTK